MSHRRFVQLATMLLVCFSMPTQAVEPATHWSFRKPVRPPVPGQAALEYGDRVRNPIDAFVLEKLQEAGLPPAPQADRYTLVRRAYCDLLGLPPTPEQIDKFVGDDSPAAWPNLIDELLESKQHGERWGRHWLDVARYADSSGYETDIYYRNAWRYRDYVVKSFNDDKPYDVFVQEQIAGDEIWPDNLDLDPRQVYVISKDKQRHLEAHLGTGFYTLGPQVHESGLDARRLKYEELTDWADTTASAFLGLTLGCARCHDHKFDPLTQHDYYAMQAIFRSSKEIDIPLVSVMQVDDWRQYYPRILAVDEARKAYRLFEKRVADREQTSDEKQKKRRLLEKIAEAVLELPEAPTRYISYDGLMEIPSASVLGHFRPELVPAVHLLDRGELSHPEAEVKSALPAVLAEATGCNKTLPDPYGSRRELALWLTGDENPLTARVMINRIWQWHFGRGIVSTPSDFGAFGEPPSHPELLDWLATEFVDHGWSMKHMHRLIMLSSTYQMSSRHATDDHLSHDPLNRHLWRMNRRRLEAETLWDAVHAVAGTLNLKMGGRPVLPPLADDEIAALREKWHWPVSADPDEHTRRGMYILVRRNFTFPMFAVFDSPVTSVSCPKRDVTTVAQQALWSLNSPSVSRQAGHLGGRVVQEAGTEPGKQVQRLWMIALSRPVEDEEKRQALQLLEGLEQAAAGGDQELLASLGELPEGLASLPPHRAAALVKLCLAVYNLNEFAFVD